jgi:hypothetical protein
MTNDNTLNAGWRKSSRSSDANHCVEAGHVPGAVLVRDTTMNSTGLVLRVTPAAWGRFTATLR